MNGLSWLIYAASVTQSIGSFFGFLAVMCGIATVISIIVTIVLLDETSSSGYSLPEDAVLQRRNIRGKSMQIAWKCGIGLFLFGVISAASPDRKTVLLIAASEIGERVVTNEKVQGVIDPSVELLKTWIAQQTQAIQQEMEQTKSAKTR